MTAGEEWPSCWEAVSALTRSEIRVAAIVRMVCGVTHSSPVSLRICRQWRPTLLTCCEVPDVRHRAQRVLGSVLTSAGEFAAARELLEAALDVALSTVGVEHPDTCETRDMLAEAHAGLGEIDEAASLAREALAGAEVFYGPTHALTLKYLVNAARHTADAGHEETARQLAERAVTTTRSTLGPLTRTPLPP